MLWMMASEYVTAAFAPETLLGEVDGVPIVFAGLLATATGVFLQLFCRRNGVTRALDHEYRLAFQDWQSHAATARKRGERPPRPPKQPGELLLRVPLILEDDLRTKYVLTNTWYRGLELNGSLPLRASPGSADAARPDAWSPQAHLDAPHQEWPPALHRHA